MGQYSQDMESHHRYLRRVSSRTRGKI